MGDKSVMPSPCSCSHSPPAADCSASRPADTGIWQQKHHKAPVSSVVWTYKAPTTIQTRHAESSLLLSLTSWHFPAFPKAFPGFQWLSPKHCKLACTICSFEQHSASCGYLQYQKRIPVFNKFSACQNAFHTGSWWVCELPPQLHTHEFHTWYNNCPHRTYFKDTVTRIKVCNSNPPSHKPTQPVLK